ncbi:MAG: glycosyltransferase family 4 protein [Phycisphaerales bacterium]|nr:glycosyltransferase family 4 protein [Phycisphaerales bacterium]
MAPAGLNPSLIDSQTATQAAARGSQSARLLLRGLLALTNLAEVAGRRFVTAQPLREQVRLILVGTFYHENWLRAHLAPLLRWPRVESIDVVGEGPTLRLDRVRYHNMTPATPTSAAARLARRWNTLRQVAREVKPDAIIGYHIMPNGLLALAAARLNGARAIYQMTGGPVQLLGGGWQSENPLLARLGAASVQLEHRMFEIARRFDAIVVRGESAARFVAQHKLAAVWATIPGAVESALIAPNARPDFDLISVGRLVDVKRVDRALAIIAALRTIRPGVRAAIVGDGPLMQALRRLAEQLGIADAVEFLGARDDVAALLVRSRAFLLTSCNEGLSIAALEAMAAGLPVIAPRVGDMGDVLENDVTGLVIQPDDAKTAAQRIAALLDDAPRRTALGLAARERVQRACSVDHVASRWAALFERLRDQSRAGASR